MEWQSTLYSAVVDNGWLLYCTRPITPVNLYTYRIMTCSLLYKVLKAKYIHMKLVSFLALSFQILSSKIQVKRQKMFSVSTKVINLISFHIRLNSYCLQASVSLQSFLSPSTSISICLLACLFLSLFSTFLCLLLIPPPASTLYSKSTNSC